MHKAILNSFLDRILLVECDLVEKLDWYTFLNVLNAVSLVTIIESKRIYLSWGIISTELNNGSVFIDPLYLVVAMHHILLGQEIQPFNFLALQIDNVHSLLSLKGWLK